MSAAIEKSDLYVIGTAQPAAERDAASHETSLYTTDEKRAWADDVAERRLDEIPIVWQHAGAETGVNMPTDAAGHIRAPANKKMGRVMHGLVDRDGRLLVVAQLYWDAPETADVRARLQRGERLGFSLGTNFDRAFASVQNKRIDHLGITEAPAFGTEISADGKSAGTWLHAATLTPDALVREMQPFLDEPGMYVPARVRDAYTRAIKQDALLPAMPAATPLAVSVGASATIMASTASVAATVNEAINNALVPPLPPPPVSAPAAEPLLSAEETERSLAKLNQEVATNFAKYPEGPLTFEGFGRARALEQEYGLLMKRAGIEYSRLTPEAKRALQQLGDVLEVYREYMRRAVHETQPTEEDRKRVIESMLLPEQRHVANFVLGAATKLKNAADEEARVRKEVAAKKALDEQEAAKSALEKRLRDEFDAERKKLREEQDKELQQLKRARVEPAATAPAATAAEPVSVGASAGVNSYDRFKRSPNDRVTVVPRNDLFIQSFIPPPSSKSFTGDVRFYAPWLIPEKDPFGQMYKGVADILETTKKDPNMNACIRNPDWIGLKANDL